MMTSPSTANDKQLWMRPRIGMRKNGSQNSQATTPTRKECRSGVRCDWRTSPRERVVARIPGEHADNHMLSSKGITADFGTNNPIVTDEFSDFVPVGARELDAIERYLGAEIDQLLRLCK